MEPKRRATAYCSVCNKHVILSNAGTIIEHKNDETSEVCVGSDKEGLWNPK